MASRIKREPLRQAEDKQLIVPFLWFDDSAEAAAELYVSLFNNSATGDTTRYDEEAAKVSGRPEGSVMTVPFSLKELEFVALNGGPEFSFTPAVSLFVACESEEEIDRLWGKLAEGGKVLMELQKYPFSEKFGWLDDRFGVSWQFNLAPREQKITPCLMYVGAQDGKAEEAARQYAAVFSAVGKPSEVKRVERYGAGEGGTEGAVKHGVLSLGGYEFIFMDGGLQHDFSFTPAISFLTNCENQEEVDELWEKLSEGGEQIQCGWLKDAWGVSWQIVPRVLDQMLQDKDAQKAKRVMRAMLQMKKLDIAELERAYESATR